MGIVNRKHDGEGEASDREVRERLGVMEASCGGRGPLAKRIGVSRNVLDRYMLGGRVYAGSALLLRRAVGLDPLSTNYRPSRSGR